MSPFAVRADAAALPKPQWPSRPWLVFALFTVIYLLVWAGHLDSGDSSFRIAWAKAMLFQHSARIDGAGLGASYCKYAIGHSLIAMPFLAAARVFHELTHLRAEGPIYMLLFVLNAAAFLALVAVYLRERFDSSAIRRTLLVLGLCTVWLPCSRMDSIEQLVLTPLFGGFLLTRRGHPVTGMMVASVAITIRPDAVLLVALLGAWYWWPQKRIRLAVVLVLACVPALAVNGVANWVRWGTVFESGYSGESFSYPFLEGLYGILASSGKSVFLYSPPLLLGLCGAYRGRCRDYWFFLAVFVCQILLYACWWDWSGDDAWGVRFLNPGVMLACIPIAELLAGRRWPPAAALVACAGLCVQLLAVLVDPMAADYAVRHFALKYPAVYLGQDIHGVKRADIGDIRFNPRYSPLAVNWLMLRVLAQHPPALLQDPVEIARIGEPLYDTLLAAGWRAESVQCDLFWVRLLRGGK